MIDRLLNWHHAGTRYQALCTKYQTAVAFNNYCVYNAASVGRRRDCCFFFRSLSNCFHANVVIIGSTSFQVEDFIALF